MIRAFFAQQSFACVTRKGKAIECVTREGSNFSLASVGTDKLVYFERG